MRLQQDGKHPMDETVWLLEFLAKSEGAEHLKLESRNLNFVQYHCIDVIIFLIVSITVLLNLTKLFCCRRKEKAKLEWILNAKQPSQVI